MQQILIRFPGGKIILFLDNFPSHNTPKVKAFFLANDRFQIVWLPKYSPKLNVIESVWKELKNVIGNWFYSTISEMERAIMKFFRKLWYDKEKIISLTALNKKYSI